MSEIKERALRIKRIRKVRAYWRSTLPFFGHRNHLTATHEFQLLDVLRDIRAVLMLILLVVVFRGFL